MKERIEKYLSEVINKALSKNFKFKVVGRNTYYQVFIEAGIPIYMDCFRHAIEDFTNDYINIDCSCVCISPWDEDGEGDSVEGFCLMIEVYW